MRPKARSFVEVADVQRARVSIVTGVDEIENPGIHEISEPDVHYRTNKHAKLRGCRYIRRGLRICNKTIVRALRDV